MNIYDFSYKTGSSFSNLYSPKDDTNQEDYYYGELFFTSDLITGINSTRLSFNGQTLVEQTATLYTAGFQQAYLNSGDYYIKSGSSFKHIAFNENFDTSRASFYPFNYNIKDDFRESPVGTGNTRTNKQTNLKSEINRKFPDRTNSFTGMSSFDYFFNGQKLYSGITESVGSYYIDGSNQFIYLDGLPSETKTGKLFAITKNTGIKNITGNSADIYGDRFVENTVFAYVNGVSLNKKNWLELSTGVKLIATGLQSSIFETVINKQDIIL
jgi:hypothetical protein